LSTAEVIVYQLRFEGNTPMGRYRTRWLSKVLEDIKEPVDLAKN
jgi:hypothetical protein